MMVVLNLQNCFTLSSYKSIKLCKLANLEGILPPTSELSIKQYSEDIAEYILIGKSSNSKEEERINEKHSQCGDVASKIGEITVAFDAGIVITVIEVGRVHGGAGAWVSA
ncbi:hypothetical protein LXL04_039509 [Taraxacum kok-saghyz]